MTVKQSTAPATARAHAISSSIASAQSVSKRCEARLDASRHQVQRADAVVRRVRVFLDAYEQRCDRAVAHPLSPEDGTGRRRR